MKLISSIKDFQLFSYSMYLYGRAPSLSQCAFSMTDTPTKTILQAMNAVINQLSYNMVCWKALTVATVSSGLSLSLLLYSVTDNKTKTGEIWKGT